MFKSLALSAALLLSSLTPLSAQFKETAVPEYYLQYVPCVAGVTLGLLGVGGSQSVRNVLTEARIILSLADTLPPLSWVPRSSGMSMVGAGERLLIPLLPASQPFVSITTGTTGGTRSPVLAAECFPPRLAIGPSSPSNACSD